MKIIITKIITIESLLPQTTSMDKVFETISSFHVKYRTTGNF